MMNNLKIVIMTKTLENCAAQDSLGRAKTETDAIEVRKCGTSLNRLTLSEKSER